MVGLNLPMKAQFAANSELMSTEALILRPPMHIDTPTAAKKPLKRRNCVKSNNHVHKLTSFFIINNTLVDREREGGEQLAEVEVAKDVDEDARQNAAEGQQEKDGGMKLSRGRVNHACFQASKQTTIIIRVV